MERPLWDRIQEIYDSTLSVPQSERSAFVASACNEDPFLVREVRSLLKADDSSDRFLETPVFELGLRIISGDIDNRSARLNGSGDSLVGKTIEGRFLVERALSKGGIGQVYCALDLKLPPKRVVIKVLLDATVTDEYLVKKFRHEAEALARIDHPNVVNVLGAGELPDGKPFVVMQYVSGVTLRSQIPVEGMDLERAARILKQVGAALDDVHEKGILHRDLKPENIMLQPLKGGEELVKVVDFGIAKVKDSVVAPSTLESVHIGTLVYMSPEQLRGGERLTAASDIYSMGVIAYEMVTGRRPFNPTSGPQLLEMHRDGVRVKPVDLRPNLSTEAQAIILRALSFDRSARYQSAAEFGDSLARALLKEDEPAALFTRSGSVSRPFPLGKIHYAVIGGVLILLISVLVFFWGTRKITTEPKKDEPRPSPTEQPATPTRSFIFSLTVQRMRNNKPYDKEFLSNDQDVFDTGDKFRLNVTSSNPGYVYVFNEGTPEPNTSSFTILYPTPRINDGSATLGAGQKVETSWNEFRGQRGTENLWIVWATAPVRELELAKTEAFNRRGILSGQTLDTVKAFLTMKQTESDPKINRDKNTQLTTVRGTGDVVVKMLALKHR